MPIFMKIDGVTGQCTVEGYKEQIELHSLQFGCGVGVSSNVRNEERTTSAPSVSEITITKETDKTSPVLMQHLLNGDNVGAVIITLCRSDKGELIEMLQLTAAETVLTGFSISSGGDRPSESLSLNFTKLTFEYTAQKSEGGKEGELKAIWDSATVKKGE